MPDGQGPSPSTDIEPLDTAARLAKNSAALFAVATVTQGAGLIVAVLVARYLGPAALGTYAVVTGLAEVFKVLAPLGQRYVVIREVARDRSRLLSQWVNASLVTFAFSLVLAVVLVVIVHLVGYNPATRTSAYVVALYLPLAGLYLVARAAVQGLERMEYLTVSAFVGRVLGLLALWLLLASGVGVEAAFIGNGLFQLVALLILVWIILRLGRNWALEDWHPSIDLWRTTAGASLPFALQDGLSMAFTRVNTIILPLLLTMATVGIFNAADRVRQTSAMIVPMVTMAILPTLSSAFIAGRGRPTVLMEKALKLMLIVIFPFVAIIAVAADQIIALLYGPGYEAAPVLRVVIWSQVFFVADAVLIQAMAASDNERPMVRRTALSLAASVVLTLVLVPRLGVVGAAWAVVFSRLLSLGLNAQFVHRHITRVNLKETVGKPLLCAALAAGVVFALRNQELYMLLIVSATTYVVLLLVLGVFSRDELLLVRELSIRLWHRVAVLRR